RLQVQRPPGDPGHGRLAAQAHRHRHRSQGCIDDHGRVRRPRLHAARGARSRRRGHLPLAAVVLLCADDPRQRRQGGARRLRAAEVRAAGRRHPARDPRAHPGQRIGYIAMPPTTPDREELRGAIFVAQAVTGYAYPNAVMQYAVGDLEKASVDVAALQRRRDRLISALAEMGYETVTPEGTFY